MVVQQAKNTPITSLDRISIGTRALVASYLILRAEGRTGFGPGIRQQVVGLVANPGQDIGAADGATLHL